MRPEPDENSEGSRYWRAAPGAAGGRGPRRRGARRRTRTTRAATRTSGSRRRRSRARTPPARSTGSAGTDEAIALAEAELADARRWGAPGTVGPSLRVLGRAAARGRDRRCWRRRSTVLERSHARLELAKALADLGSALRRDRRPSDAREPLRRALELADACGGGRPGRARAQRAVRDRRTPAHDGARRRRRADRERAPRGRVRGRRAEQPRHRAGAVRDAQDRRGPPQQRLPQARHPLPPRARRGAVEPIERLGTAFGGHPDGAGRRRAPSCRA